MTPKISQHARERCEEMGISTKVAKAIVRHPSLTRPAPPRHGEGCVVIESTRYPQYAVAYNPRRNVVITVIFNERNFVARNGTTCEVASRHAL